MNKILFALDCALWAVLGGLLGLAGVHPMTWRGAAIWGLLLAIVFVHASQAVRAYRKGQLNGAATAVAVMLREGWRKQ